MSDQDQAISVNSAEIVFNNRNGIPVTLTVEAPIGTPTGIVQTVPAMSTAHLPLGMNNLQSVLLTVEDSAHGMSRQSFAMAPPTVGRPCYLESVTVDYVIGSFTGTLNARTPGFLEEETKKEAY